MPCQHGPSVFNLSVSGGPSRLPRCGGRAGVFKNRKQKTRGGRCGNLTRFHSVCVASDTQRAHTRSMTLREMAKTALAGGDLATERALLLKVDPEGAEVGALEAASDDGTLASVSSIAVEIHGYSIVLSAQRGG